VHTAADRDGAVLLDTARDRLYGLNPTAAALWERLSTGEEPHAVADDLAARWGVDAKRLRADVLVLTDALLRLGLATPAKEAR
jgi:hypothetical protein